MSAGDQVKTDPFQPHDPDSPEDEMQGIEMVAASERVKLGRERLKCLGMRKGDVRIDLNRFSQRHRRHVT